MSWASLLLSLHTAAEFFLVGIECQARLEQVKTRNWQVVIAEVGNGLGDGGLILSAILRLSDKCGIFGRLLRRYDNWC
ncbi:hypothetical protein IMSAGC008_02134 [Muribaculaceae bacterium]|nr:hypothetical protein IMSAGC008_02134 [Muribaculaceae bacterium]